MFHKTLAPAARVGALATLAAFAALGPSACNRGGASAGGATAASTATAVTAAAGARVDISVDGSGYHPATVRAAAGQPLTLVFTRTSDEGCGQQVAIPSMNITRDLPLNQAVAVTMTPTAG